MSAVTQVSQRGHDDDDDDGAVFWKLRNVDASYWHEYVATRPVYDDKIFQPILGYQASHSPNRYAALDIGTGSGSALGPLANHFEQVVATDNDAVSLAFARKRHANILPAKRIQYTLSSGEDLVKHLDPASFDLITCAETFPLLDSQTALNNMATLLRPQGTLAIWFYGPPFFTEPDLAPVCQPILDALMDLNFLPVIQAGNDAQRRGWQRAADGMFSWLDNVALDPDHWHHVRRQKWNPHARLSFFTNNNNNFDVQHPVSMVRHDDETVSEGADASFWQVGWDIDMVARFVKASFPKPSDADADPNHSSSTMDELLHKLAVGMGGHGAVRTLSWPVVLILAARKDKE